MTTKRNRNCLASDRRPERRRCECTGGVTGATIPPDPAYKSMMNTDTSMQTEREKIAKRGQLTSHSARGGAPVRERMMQLLNEIRPRTSIGSVPLSTPDRGRTEGRRKE